jgi:hypothetical protein
MHYVPAHPQIMNVILLLLLQLIYALKRLSSVISCVEMSHVNYAMEQ